jgi:hypothetical protein
MAELALAEFAITIAIPTPAKSPLQDQNDVHSNPLEDVMKSLNAITSRLRNPRSKCLRASVMLLAGAAVLSAMAATHHRPSRVSAAVVEDAPATPVAGLNYGMRLDTQRGRVQFFGADARLSGIVPADSRGCHADLTALQPGLWLAVTETAEDGHSELVLQPFGNATPERAVAVNVHSCDETAATHGVVLPAALRARIQQQGGVLFVDGDNAQNAHEASLAQGNL